MEEGDIEGENDQENPAAANNNSTTQSDWHTVMLYTKSNPYFLRVNSEFPCNDYRESLGMRL